MTYVEYISKYQSKIKELRVIDMDNPEDEGFHPSNITEEMYKAFNRLDLKPEQLAEWVEVKGGGEYHDVESTPYLKALMEFYEEFDLENEEEDLSISDITISLKEGEELLNNILRRMYKTEGVKLDKVAEWQYEGETTLDRMLGHLFHQISKIILEGNMYILPGGDDSYFDYYPGEMFSMTWFIEWFLNSNNRMV